MFTFFCIIINENLLNEPFHNSIYFLHDSFIGNHVKKSFDSISSKINQQAMERMRRLVNILHYNTEDNQQFLDYALSEAIELTHSRLGYIYFYNEAEQQFTLNTWSKEVMKECTIQDPQTIYQLEKTGLWGEAVRQRKTIIENDFYKPNPLKKGYPEGHAPLKKFLTVPIFDEGKIVAVIGVANKETDYDESDALQLSLLMDSVWKIVDRRIALSAFRDSETKLRSLINATQDIVLLKDKDFKHVMVNQAAQQFFHRTEKEIIGKTDFDLLPAESARACRLSDQKALEKKALVIEYEQVQSQFFEARKFPVPLSDQTGIGCFITDITKQVKADESLLLQSKVLEAVANAVVITDPDGKIEWVNPAFTKLTGFNNNESQGRNPRDLVRSGVQEISFYADMWQTIKKKKSWKGVLVNRKKNGSLYSEEMTITPLISEKGEILHFIAVKQDITEREQHEKELTVIANVSSALRNAQNKQEMLPVILDQLLEQLKIEGATLILHDPLSDEMVIELGRGLWANSTGLRIPPGKGLSRKIMENGKPCVYNDSQDNPDSYYKNVFKNCTASAAVPLSVQEQKIGAIFIGTNRKITDRDIRLLSSIADIAASAINRSTLHEKTQEKVKQLDALRTIDQAINTSLDLKVTLNVILKQAKELLTCDALLVMFSKPQTMTLEYAASLGFRTREIEHTSFRIGKGFAGRSILERQTVSIDLEKIDPEILPEEQLFLVEGFHSVHSVPLSVKGNVKGILIACYSRPFRQSIEWQEILNTLATQIAIAIDNNELFEGLQQSTFNLSVAYNETIEGWAKALDLRDHETGDHSKRVAQMTIDLAYELGIKNESIGDIMRGAYLHDIGKMGIPDAVLNKPGKLTDEEWDMVRRHPQFAYDMLSSIKYLQPALDIPYCHHEKWDGSGYPRGLKGEEIPLAARIFAVVDVWDALISDRPYRKAWTEEKAMQYLQEQSGKHFDPQVINAFFKMKNQNY